MGRVLKDKGLILGMGGGTLLLLLIVFGGFFFSSQKGYKKTGKLHDGVITIGTGTWPGYIGLYVARDMGYFLDEGIQVEIAQYEDLDLLSKDYVEGKLHGRANLSFNAINERLEGLDHKIVLAMDHSSGADFIVAHKEIETVKDIKGKLIAFQSGTMEEFFLSRVLAQEGMTLDDIIPVLTDQDKGMELIQKERVDAAVFHKASLSQTALPTDYHTLYSSKHSEGTITDVLTLRTDFIEKNPDTIAAILRGYFKALDYIKQNPDNAHWIVAKEFNIPAAEVANQLEGLVLLDKRNNVKEFQFSTAQDSLFGKMRKIGSFVRKHRKTAAETLDTDQLIEPFFVQEEIANAVPNIRPTKGRINSFFGMRIHPIHRDRRFHAGIDIANASGTPVVATADGEIIYTGWKGGYGRTVIIRHSPTHKTQYSHLKKITVDAFQKVRQGTTIGTVGSTGLSTGPHLHYEVLEKEIPRNPLNFISKKAEKVAKGGYNVEESGNLNIH